MKATQLVVEYMDGQVRYYPFNDELNSAESWTRNIPNNEIVIRFPGNNRTHIPLCNVRNYAIEKYVVAEKLLPPDHDQLPRKFCGNIVIYPHIAHDWIEFMGEVPKGPSIKWFCSGQDVE